VFLQSQRVRLRAGRFSIPKWHRRTREDAGGAPSPRGSTTTKQRTRRAFLRDVGTGVVVASVGAGLAADLGFATAFAEQGPERLTFGPLERLVGLTQERQADRLLPRVVERLRQGTPLREVVAGGAAEAHRAAEGGGKAPPGEEGGAADDDGPP
jgi:hypothetical protein